MSSATVINAPAGGWQSPWPQVFEITGELPADRWLLVGGLMVQAHSLAAGVESSRVTIDVDALVRVDAGAASYGATAALLLQLGYAADTSTTRAYRFARGGEIVDLMVADHGHPPARFARRDVLAVPGGRQALARREMLGFRVDGRVAYVPVPSLHGALVLKAAAHQADSRDRECHLLDAMTLLACVMDVEAIIGDLRGSDGKRLRHLLRALNERPLVAAQLPIDTGQLAERSLAALHEWARR